MKFLVWMLGPALLAASVASAQGTPALKAADASVDDLPLIEVPAPDSKSDTLGIVVSGDGGWAAIDKGISSYLAGHEVPVVGLNALKYFWNARTPDEAAKDVARILRHYLAAWRKDKAILVGYSFGADVIPFMVSRLPADLAPRVKGIALLAASPNATFQFHLTDWLPGLSGHRNDYPTKPEVEKLKGTKVLCVYGEDDKECLCTQLSPQTATVVKLPGSHHFDRDYDGLAALILKELSTPALPAPSAPASAKTPR